MPKKAQDQEKNKQTAIDNAIKKIEKDFGKGSIMIMGDEHVTNIQVIPSGSLALDLALGVGGFPRGRIIEIYGPESSGKTTLTLHAIAEAQKTGGIAAFVDAEHALDPVYARNLGVDLDSLLISQPGSGEEALEIVETLVRSGAVDLIIIDSVAALVPRAEIEGNMGDAQMGLQARLMSQALRKLSSVVNKSNTCVIFTNQLRMKIGVTFGNPETTTGGMALKFYASVRMDVRRIGALKESAEFVGNETRVKVVKNKVAPPFKEAYFDIIYGKGIVRENELITLGEVDDFILKKGSWFSYITPDDEDINIGQGKNSAVAFLKDNPAIRFELENRIREKHEIPLLDAEDLDIPAEEMISDNGEAEEE
ncbi:MAG TPA: recombinase RecA [Thermotogota bacterium]|nr:recombinase RecA [Thermotogota bacterium]HPJ88102.1 recombinase RecA [Thermotogota bacterium]HPR96038.1 recombinase RecA [Thermotogota bacterium]